MIALPFYNQKIVLSEFIVASKIIGTPFISRSCNRISPSTERSVIVLPSINLAGELNAIDILLDGSIPVAPSLGVKLTINSRFAVKQDELNSISLPVESRRPNIPTQTRCSLVKGTVSYTHLTLPPILLV